MPNDGMADHGRREWPPGSWRRLDAVDTHAAGEPLRIFISGFPDPPGDTMVEKRRHAEEHLDSLRRMTMWEPRGHADMYGCVVTEPVTPDADFGVLFLHNAGFSTMCGHGIIAVATIAADCGWVDAGGERTRMAIDTPAGRVTAVAHSEDGRVRRVTFRNVPSFVVATDVTVGVDGIGEVRCDVAFGGAFYAYVDSAALGIDLIPPTGRLIEAGMKIKHAVAAAVDVSHPDGDPDLGFLYGTIFVGPPHGRGANSRNVCIFADGEVDRSPTGTGVSGRLALHSLRGDLPAEPVVVESIIGSIFTGEVVAETTVGGLPAVVPEIGGSAHVVGRSELIIDPDDPLRGGFFLR